MDPSLLRERDAFLKRAKATPVVETQKRKAKPSEKDDKKAKKPKIKSETSSAPMDYKMSTGSSNYKFGVLAKIVRFLKVFDTDNSTIYSPEEKFKQLFTASRYQEDMNEPLLMEEILNETKQLDINSKMKHWLATESLVNNPKVTVIMEDGANKFSFKPKFDIRGKKDLVKLLKSYDIHGKGGICKDDIEESLPDTEKILKAVSDYVIKVHRPQDKKQVLFYNDRYCRFSVDDDFRKLWRGIGVDGLDEAKIEEYLTKHGISSMDATTLKKVSKVPRRKGKQKNRNFKRHNDHLQGVLRDYHTTSVGENKTG